MISPQGYFAAKRGIAHDKWCSVGDYMNGKPRTKNEVAGNPFKIVKVGACLKGETTTLKEIDLK